MKETVLNTIRNNLIGEDDDRREKTIALLKQDPVLTQMVLDGPDLPVPVIRAMTKKY